MFFKLTAIFMLLSVSLAAWSESVKVPKAFASGESKELLWEARFNLPTCKNAGKREGAWCTLNDVKASTEVSGVEAKLKSWINDPKIKSIHMAYFSFKNKNIIKSLCEAALNGKRVTLYINLSYFKQDYFLRGLKKCGSNFSVIPRGRGFDKGSLQHTKVFLASEQESLKPLSEMSESEKSELSTARLRFTSSSANMSEYGTNIHIENWLFFNDRLKSYLAQQQVCMFKAFADKGGLSHERIQKFLEHTKELKRAQSHGEFDKEKELRAKLDQFNTDVDRVVKANYSSYPRVYSSCIKRIQESKREDINFYPVPRSGSFRYTRGNSRDLVAKCAIKKNSSVRPFCAMALMLKSAQKEVLIAIHRLTTQTIVDDVLLGVGLRQKVWHRRPRFRVIQDDDTLRHAVQNGGGGLDVGKDDVFMYRKMREVAKVKFMETNGRVKARKGHLFHNKFIVVDGKELFQGAGNFTSTALNVSGKGNYEQFYHIKVPEIAQAYKSAFEELYKRASWPSEHTDQIGTHSDSKCYRVKGRYCDTSRAESYINNPKRRSPVDYE